MTPDRRLLWNVYVMRHHERSWRHICAILHVTVADAKGLYEAAREEARERQRALERT